MPNETARDFLMSQITALNITVQELTRIFSSTGDLDLADRIRSRITDINQQIFAFQSALNSLNAAGGIIPPPSPQRVAALNAALRQLDGFVRNDQNLHAALNFLTQVASAIGSA